MCKDRRTHVTMKRYTRESPVRTLDDVDACGVHAVRHEQGTQKPKCHMYRDDVWASGKSEPDSRQEWLPSRGPLYKVWVALGGDMCGVHLPLTTAPSHHLLSGPDSTQNSFL